MLNLLSITGYKIRISRKIILLYFTKSLNTGRKVSERPKKQAKATETFVERCGGLDGGKCLESGTNSRRSADVEDWMVASVWRVGLTAEDRLMWRTGWWQVSGEWD